MPFPLHLFNILGNTFKPHIFKISVRKYTPRRALLYVPGDDDRKLNKAFKTDADCIAMDLEDGVAINKKETARGTIKNLLNEGKPHRTRNFDWGVRVNSVESGLCENDLSAVLSGNNLPDTLLLPKVESDEHLKWFSDKLSSYIKGNAKLGLIIYVESAKAIMDLRNICETAWKLSNDGKFIPCTLVFGSDDFCASIGVTRTEDSREILYARQKTVLLAKAFKLQAIDMVYINYKDLDGLKKQSEEGARLGYTGKQIIHPGQIPIVQTAFMPNAKQVEWATGLLKAFEEHQKSGKGAFTYQESMIDMPTMKQAKNVIDLVSSVK